jgi:hypothetical protein
VNNVQTVVDVIFDMVGFLSQDPLTVENISARVGPVVRDPGGPMSMELRPISPDLQAAHLARYPESGSPYVLDLDIVPGARPTVSALMARFGKYHRALTDRGRPRELLFYPPPGRRWRVVLIAELDSSAADIEDARVSAIALRRDSVSPNTP